MEKGEEELEKSYNSKELDNFSTNMNIMQCASSSNYKNYWKMEHWIFQQLHNCWHFSTIWKGLEMGNPCLRWCQIWRVNRMMWTTQNILIKHSKTNFCITFWWKERINTTWGSPWSNKHKNMLKSPHKVKEQKN